MRRHRLAWLLAVAVIVSVAGCAALLSLDEFAGAGEGGAGAGGIGGTGVTTSTGGGGGGGVPADWWDPSYRHRIKLAFSEVETPADEVPVLVRLGQSEIALASGAGDLDLCFVDADGSGPLPHEVEFWDADAAAVWVLVPQIKLGDDDFIWLYLDGAAEGCEPTPSAVWSDYEAVYHLSDDLGDHKVHSSPEPDHWGGVTGLSTSDQGPGVAGLGLHFGAAGQRIIVEDNDNPGRFAIGAGTAATFEAWVRFDDDPHTAYLAFRANASCGWMLSGTEVRQVGAVFRVDPSDDDCNGSTGSMEVTQTYQVVTGETWHQVVAVFNRESDELTLYVDGVQVGAPVMLPVSLEPPEPADLVLGGYGSGPSFPGWIDEVRFGHLALSPERIMLHWRTVDEAFPAMGDVESLPAR